jgi:basic amino acid/polyamine antiporter, APA family
MVKLKRELNLFFAVMSGVGIILGAGIYVLIGEAAGIAGNAVWLSFTLSAILAGLTGLSYAELSSMYTSDDGEFRYTLNAFGKYLAFLVAFLIIFEGIISSAAVALGFGGYLAGLIGLEIVIASKYLLAAGIVFILAVISFFGIKQSAIMNLIATIIETGGLLLIIALGYNYIGTVDYFDFSAGFVNIFRAASLIFFAFVGFEAIIKLAEETKKPEQNIPKALIISIIVCTIIYILVAISAVSILPWKTLGSSPAPLAEVAAAVLGSKAFLLLSIIALFSTGNTVLILLVTTSRMIYGISKNIPKLHMFRFVNNKTNTPSTAIIITTLLTLLFTLLKDIKIVASTSNFTIFITFLIVNLSLIKLRYSKPKFKRPFKVPLSIGKLPILPVLGALSSLFMLAFIEPIAFVGGVGLLLIGSVLYWAICYKKKNSHCKPCSS